MKTASILLLGFLTATYGLCFKLDNRKLNRFLTTAHMVLFGLAGLLIVLAVQDIGFRGAHTDRIVVSLWFATGIALFGLLRKKETGRITRIYFGIYFWTLPLLLVAWFVPRLHFAAAVLGVGIILDEDIERCPIDDIYQLQTKIQGVLAGGQVVGIVEKKLILFEKTTDDILPRDKYNRIEARRISDDSVKILLVPREPEYSTVIDTTLYLKRK